MVRAFVASKLIGRNCDKHKEITFDCAACNPPLSRNTVKNIAATLRAIFNRAQVDELLTVNPAIRLSKLLGSRRDAREHVVAVEENNVARYPPGIRKVVSRLGLYG